VVGKSAASSENDAAVDLVDRHSCDSIESFGTHFGSVSAIKRLSRFRAISDYHFRLWYYPRIPQHLPCFAAKCSALQNLRNSFNLCN
jgi:hypothetical protein